MWKERYKKISLFLILVFGLFFVSSLTLNAQQSSATLTLSPAASTLALGSTTTVDILLNTNNQDIIGVDIDSLNFDTALLEVVDSDTAVSGTQIQAGTLIPQTILNSVNTTTGTTTGEIFFSQILTGANTFRNNSAQTLATIQFRVKAIGQANVNFTFTQGSTTDTNVVSSAGQDILTSALGATFTLVPVSQCVPNWTCTDWSSCSNGTKTRTCTNANNCGSTANKPAESESCTEAPPGGGGGSSPPSGGGGGGYTPSPSPTPTPTPTPTPSPSPQINPPENYIQSPLVSETDSDGDGLKDSEEYKFGTDIYAQDTDGDGFTDEEEVRSGHDPLNPPSKSDTLFFEKHKGKIFLQVVPPRRGEAWYIHPDHKVRYYLRDGAIAYRMMQILSHGVLKKNFDRIPKDSKLQKLFFGKIVLVVDDFGKAYYYSPKDNQLHYVKDGEAAYQLMREHGFGISNTDIGKIPYRKFTLPGE